jgi:EmrB/QacA subfamily drug resistance transporter
VALPAIHRDLGGDQTMLQWVVDGYALTLAALQLIGGSAGDRFGHRTVFVTGVTLFAVASLGSGLAPTTGVLIGAVAVQGAGGALMFATTLALIARYYRGASRGTAFAIRGTVAGVAAAAGPLLGGAITTALGWRWIFFLNLPIAAVTVLIAAVTLRREVRPDRRQPLDLGGAVALSAALVLLVLALLRGNDAGWGSVQVLALFAGAAVGLVAFVLLEHRHPAPLLDLALFRRRRFAGAQVAALAAQGSLFPLYVYLSLWFQGPLGYSALQTGLRFLLITVPILLVGAAVGTLMDRFEAYRLVATGLLVMGGGLLLLCRLDAHTGWTALVPGFLVVGVGVGLTLPPLGALAVSVAEPSRVGMASGVNNTFQQIGFGTGIAGYGAVFAHQLAAARGAADGYVAGLDRLFLIAGTVALLGALLTALLSRGTRR